MRCACRAPAGSLAPRLSTCTRRTVSGKLASNPETARVNISYPGTSRQSAIGRFQLDSACRIPHAAGVPTAAGAARACPGQRRASLGRRGLAYRSAQNNATFSWVSGRDRLANHRLAPAHDLAACSREAPLIDMAAASVRV